MQKRKTSFASFIVKQRNIYVLTLLDTGNLVHSAIVSWEFIWKGWRSVTFMNL